MFSLAIHILELGSLSCLMGGVDSNRCNRINIFSFLIGTYRIGAPCFVMYQS